MTLSCSFCAKGSSEVRRLIQGPNVAICDGCVRASYQILEEVDGPSDATDPDPVVGSDDVMAAITRAQQAALSGERDEARQAFAAIWQQVGPEGDPLHRVTVAHYMADLQDDPSGELDWDLRALAAADSLTDERAQAYHSTLAVRGFYASLHLNVGSAYEKLGRVEDSRRHLTLAEQATPDLPAGGYGDLVRSGIDALRHRLNV
jgi:hypothetical protein